MCKTIISIEDSLVSGKPRGFYKSHDVRKNKLKELIDKYGRYDSSNNNEFKRICKIFTRQNDSIPNTLKELGFIIEDTMMYMPKNYYENEDIFKEKVLNFININNRFPSMIEFEKELKINTKFIYNKYGSINNLKKEFEYNDVDDLVDMRGDTNKSFAEMFVANLLIVNGLKDKYKREQYPFPREEGLYRSDFTLFVDDEFEKEIHIEVWGRTLNNYSDNSAKDYQETRKKKEALYSKYEKDIVLISVNYEVFDKKMYDVTQQEIINLLSPYIDNLKIVSYDKLIDTSKINDDELLNEAMKYSVDKIKFPFYNNLPCCIYTEILKRFGGCKEFASIYNIPLESNKKKHSKEQVFKNFSDIIKEGNQISYKNIESRLISAISRADNIMTFGDYKIEFFYEHNDNIPKSEIIWLTDVANNINNRNRKFKKYNSEHAKKILKSIAL